MFVGSVSTHADAPVAGVEEVLEGHGALKGADHIHLLPLCSPHPVSKLLRVGHRGCCVCVYAYIYMCVCLRA